MTTRKELTEAVGTRYRAASRREKQKILDEFVALTGCHRKHAIRALSCERAADVEEKGRNRVYDEATRQALIVLWEAADRVCGKRLKALVPMLTDAMERHGHLDLDPIVKDKVLTVSAATIDRMLAGTRLQIDGQRKRRKGIGAAIRRSIPVRTFADWGDPPPGFFEMDMVEHYNGPKTDGDYLHTLVLTDIASGWTECFAMRHRSQALVIDGLDRVADDLPFPMLGVDSDNDSVFMTQDVFDYCKAHRLEQTRSRAYKKNDQAWVEQKNGAIVRRLVGYGRLSGTEATKTLAQLYASSLAVHQLLPAVVQVEVEDTRRRTREEGISPAGDSVRPAHRPPGGGCHGQGDAGGRVPGPGPGEAAPADPSRSASIERYRNAWAASAAGGAEANAYAYRRVSNQPLVSLEGRRGAAHAPQEVQCHALVANPRESVRRSLACHRGLAGRRAIFQRQ